MLRVIDISDAQAGLDLSTIANQFDAVMIKATGGNGYVNAYCDGWVQQAIALGKKWGVYHYFSDGYNDADPIAEANWFVDNCSGYIGQGIFALDWERGGNANVNNTAMAAQCSAQIQARTGVPVMDYMSLSLVTGLDWSASVSQGDSLWCADYVDDNNPIYNFQMDSNRDPNPNWDGNVNDVMWQFTSTGRLDGYGGNLDCSFFYGTLASWDAYAGTHTANPSPEPTTTTTTTTAAPSPEPTTTTATTTQPDTATTTTTSTESPTGESTTTTTTTTKESQPLPPSTTTTTTQAANPPGFWAGVVATIKAIFKALFGKVEE